MTAKADGSAPGCAAGEGVGVGAVGAAEAGAVVGAAVVAVAGGGEEGAGVIVMVRPSLPKLASRGTLPLIVSSAVPLTSTKPAEEIALLLKLTVGVPETTTGSRVNAMRSFPGSVAIFGL